MSTATSEYPILSLPAVLFPGTFLPVQISEPAHRQLLHDCADEGKLLGVILHPGQNGHGSGPAAACTVGCTASVALLLDADAPDTMNVVLYGEQRMRVETLIQQEPYARATLEVMEDYLGENAERRGKQASRLFQRYLDLIRRRYKAQVVNLPLPDDPIMASYLLAAVLFLPLELKQHWLESASVAMRLQEELSFLHTECEKIATLLALSHQTQHNYAPPDKEYFNALFTQN